MGEYLVDSVWCVTGTSGLRRILIYWVMFVLVSTLVVGLSPSAHAHTKGISLSRYGLVDVSWTGNIVYGNFTDYEEGFNPTKLGERQFRGLSLTSFDLSFTQDCFILYANIPCKWALFTGEDWGLPGQLCQIEPVPRP
jgi:hypothetical protein